MFRVAPSVYKIILRPPLVSLLSSLSLSLCQSLFLPTQRRPLSYLCTQNTLFIVNILICLRYILFEYFAVGHLLDGRPLRFDARMNRAWKERALLAGRRR